MARIARGIVLLALCLLSGAALAQVGEGTPEADLFAGVYANDLAAVQAALNAGADVFAENADGNTAADVAVDRSFFDIAHYLLGVADRLRQARADDAVAQADRQAAPQPPPPSVPPSVLPSVSPSAPQASPASSPTPARTERVPPGPSAPVLPPGAPDPFAPGELAATGLPETSPDDAGQPAPTQLMTRSAPPEVAGAPASPEPAENMPEPDAPSPPSPNAQADEATFMDRFMDFIGSDESPSQSGDAAPTPPTTPVIPAAPAPQNPTPNSNAPPIPAPTPPVVATAPANPAEPVDDGLSDFPQPARTFTDVLAVELGPAARPPAGAGAPCIKKNATPPRLVCVQPATWPSGLLAGSETLPASVFKQSGRAGTRAVVSYGADGARYVQTAFASADFDAVVAHFTQRFGSPDESFTRIAAPLGAARTSNPVRRWVGHVDGDSREAVLDVIKFDDVSDMFPDMARGAVVFKFHGEPDVFRYVTTVELIGVR